MTRKTLAQAAFLAATVWSVSFSALAENAGATDSQVTGGVNATTDLDARGVILPNAEVTLGAGVAAKIAQMPFKAGQSFNKGEPLIVFDCAQQKADLRGAQSSLAKAASVYKSKRQLKKRGAAGSQEVREAAADVATTQATVDGLREVLKYCDIKAPFDGRVLERHARSV